MTSSENFEQWEARFITLSSRGAVLVAMLAACIAYALLPFASSFLPFATDCATGVCVERSSFLGLTEEVCTVCNTPTALSLDTPLAEVRTFRVPVGRAASSSASRAGVLLAAYAFLVSYALCRFRSKAVVVMALGCVATPLLWFPFGVAFGVDGPELAGGFVIQLAILTPLVIAFRASFVAQRCRILSCCIREQVCRNPTETKAHARRAVIVAAEAMANRRFRFFFS